MRFRHRTRALRPAAAGGFDAGANNRFRGEALVFSGATGTNSGYVLSTA